MQFVKFAKNIIWEMLPKYKKYRNTKALQFALEGVFVE